MAAMAATTDSMTSLAYDDEGAGTPVVFLHGLTFDRRTWWPIIERLGGCVPSLAIDLPGPTRDEPDRVLFRDHCALRRTVVRLTLMQSLSVLF